MKLITFMSSILLLSTSMSANAVQINIQGLEQLPLDSNFELAYRLFTDCKQNGAQYQCSETAISGIVPVQNVKPLLSMIGRRAEMFDHNHAAPYQDSTLSLTLQNAPNRCHIVLTHKQTVDILFNKNGTCNLAN